ncbi:hypothetical protein H1R20_g5557, partial [Candolleomyces eurysporus]
MNSLLSLGGWAFIPDFATKHVLNFIYQTPAIHRTLRITPSPPHTAQYRRHYRVTFAFVVLGYLLYSLFEKLKNPPPNFYEVLGVASTVDDAGLKAAFRQFAKRNHPDRPEVGKQGEALFIFVRNVFEGLKEPAVRFGYDRFGPEALKWKGQCVTKAEFLWHGMLTSSGYHIVSALVLLFWTALGSSSPFTFWRWILFFMLLVAEVALITTPSPSLSNRHITILHKIFPQRVVYQHILFLHQLFMFLNVALLRVTPYLIPVDEFADPGLELALLDRTTALVNMADREASKMVHTELQSIANPVPSSSSAPSDSGFSSTPQHPSFARMEPVSPQTATQLLNELAPEMESLIIETNVKQGAGPLKTAWEMAVGRAYKRIMEDKQKQRAQVETEQEREAEQRSPSQSRETTPTPSTPSRVPPAANNADAIVVCICIHRESQSRGGRRDHFSERERVLYYRLHSYTI